MTSHKLSSQHTLNPLIWLATSFAIGIAAANATGLGPAGSLIAGAAMCAAAFAFRGSTWSMALCCVAFIALGSFCCAIEKASIRDDRIRNIYDDGRIASRDPVEIEGKVIGGAEPAFDGVFLTIDTHGLIRYGEMMPATGIVRLYLPTISDEAKADLDSLDLRHGTPIRSACELEREDKFLNPGVTPRRELLDRQGIDATCTVKSPLLIEVVDGERSSGIISFVFEIRRHLIMDIRERFDTRTAGVLTASMLGDKYFLDRKTAEVFREGGTFHILVISGLHITFIGAVLLLIVRRLTRRRLYQFAVTMTILWVYTIAVGAGSPVVRASVMFTTVLFGHTIFRTATLLNGLGASALVLLALRPTDLFDPSFQLTFASVAGIVAVAFPLIEKLRSIGGWMPTSKQPFPPNVPTWLARICETLYWNPRAWEIDQQRQVWSARIFKSPIVPQLADIGLRRPIVFIFEGLIVSLIVQLWLLPLTIFYFHRVAFSSVLLNLWVGPLMAAESFTAIAAVLVGQINNAAALPLVSVTELLNTAMLSLPQAFVASGFSGIRPPAFAGDAALIYIVYFVPLAIAARSLLTWDPFTMTRQTRKKWILKTLVPAGAVVIASVFVMVAPIVRVPAADGKLTVHFLDVGQGDSAFITFPNGETMLIDGGGQVTYRDRNDDEQEHFEPDVARIGEMVVSEAIWEMGYSRIDHLVVSHADADHSQGAADVLKNFSVGTVSIGTWPVGESELDEVFAAASANEVPVRQLGAGDEVEIGGVRLETLWPAVGAGGSGSDNNSSLVLRLTYGEHKFVFTGDIEREAEQSLIASGVDLAADVVKVPHHGSRTSSTESFVNAVRPQIAVIPVGRRSRFGHPHQEVTERWKTAESRVITTGERGMVTISSDGRDLSVKTFVP